MISMKGMLYVLVNKFSALYDFTEVPTRRCNFLASANVQTQCSVRYSHYII